MSTTIHVRKQRWKLVLAIGATIIVFASLWYTNLLVNKIAREERNKIKLWAEAIKKKNDLVNYTIGLFDVLGVEEEKKVTLWAQATQYLANSETLDDYTFVVQVIESNATVPIITTNGQGKIKGFRNLGKEYDLNDSTDLAAVEQRLEQMKEINEPIVIKIYGSKVDYLYYDNSTIVTELKFVMDNLVQSFISEIVVNSASVPVILTDETQTEIISSGNVKETILNDDVKTLALLQDMADQNDPIELNLGHQGKQYIFYRDSDLLLQLKYYPYFQLGIIALFLILAYYLFSTSRRVEQNRVWVGMAKETAHQLGTPLSSLIAWLELLKSSNADETTVQEIGKDLHRLEKITERFSKIGSEPKLEPSDLTECIDNVVGYLKNRVSKSVEFVCQSTPEKIRVNMNVPLFEWVLENIIKNAVDSMGGKGKIELVSHLEAGKVIIDITDSGKGIRRSHWKSVFEPGMTSKKRGWGLGLSLVKRIVENYHGGKVFVKWSEFDKGTTFRIVLNN